MSDASKTPHNPSVALKAGPPAWLAPLNTYVRAHAPQLGTLTHVERFAAGHSNLTFMLQNEAGAQWVLRRPPQGAQVKTGHDMSREHRVLRGLASSQVPCPAPVILCEDPEVLGAPFYIMERVEGVILRAPTSPWPEDVMAGVCAAFVDALVKIHGVDLKRVGLQDLGQPQGYVARQVKGWTGRYARAKTDDIPEMQKVASWLDAHQPLSGQGTLIHNDFKYDNLVLAPDDPTTLRSVLDWEMATLGDPLMDLGTSLGYWVDPGDDPSIKAFQMGPTTAPGNLTREGLVEAYAAASGRDVGDALFYYVFGLFKICVIAQQIYARFVQGHTQDPRFGGLIHAVRALSRAAWRAIQVGRISG